MYLEHSQHYKGEEVMNTSKGQFLKSNGTGKIYVVTGLGAAFVDENWEHRQVAYKAIGTDKPDNVYVAPESYFDDHFTNVTDQVLAKVQEAETIDMSDAQVSAARSFLA